MRIGSLAVRAFEVIPPRWQNRRGLAGAGALLGIILLVCFGFGPLVRYRAQKVARNYGMTVEIGTVWPALGGANLRNVRFRAGQSDWLSGEFAKVDVRIGIGLGLRALRVHGGRIAIAGSIDEVSEQARALNKGSLSNSGGSGESGGAELLVEGVRAAWTGAIDPSSTFEIDGLRVERSAAEGGKAPGMVGVDAIRLDKGGLHGRGRSFLARFVREGRTTRFTEARLQGLDIEVPLRGTAAAAAAAPAAVVGAAAGARPPAGSPGAKGGYVEKAIRLRNRLTQLAAWGTEHLLPEAPVELNGFTVVLTQADKRLNVGPGSLRVRHDARALDLDFSPGQADSRAKGDPSQLSFQAHIPAQHDEIAIHVQGGPVTLASLGVHEQDFGLFDVGRAKLEAKGDVKLSADAERLLFEGDGRLTSLSVVYRALSDEPVRGLDLGWRARGVAALDGSLVRIDEGKVELGAIRLEAFGNVEQGADFVRIDARAGVPNSDCQKMFESLPQALVPKLVGMKMTGSFGLRSGFILDTRHPNDMEIDWELKNKCRIIKAPPDIDVERFEAPFKHIVYDEKGEKIEVLSGPGTPEWVEYHVISPFMEAAVTTTEDGGFRSHKGFDKTAIKNSIRDNLRTGRFVRGASTITMQLAKNLYLEREKNLSRKLQEAVLTTYLEQSLTKDQILELYFNIVEFGPMLYGIGPASEYYFNASPHDLSLGQALFLSSLLPNPKRSYFSPTGQVTKGWLTYLHRLMKIMRTRNKITDEELLDGVSEVITFQVAKSPRVRPSPTDLKRELGSDLSGIVPEGP